MSEYNSTPNTEKAREFEKKIAGLLLDVVLGKNPRPVVEIDPPVNEQWSYEKSDHDDNLWYILDGKGDHVATVVSQDEETVRQMTAAPWLYKATTSTAGYLGGASLFPMQTPGGQVVIPIPEKCAIDLAKMLTNALERGSDPEPVQPEPAPATQEPEEEPVVYSVATPSPEIPLAIGPRFSVFPFSSPRFG